MLEFEININYFLGHHADCQPVRVHDLGFDDLYPVDSVNKTTLNSLQTIYYTDICHKKPHFREKINIPQICMHFSARIGCSRAGKSQASRFQGLFGNFLSHREHWPDSSIASTTNRKPLYRYFEGATTSW